MFIMIRLKLQNPADCIMEAVRKRRQNPAANAAAEGLIPSFLLSDHVPELRIVNKQASVSNMLLMVHIRS